MIQNDQSDQSEIERLEQIFNKQKLAFSKNPYPDCKQRIELMRKIPDMLMKNRNKIIECLHLDYGYHSPQTAEIHEILSSINRFRYNSSQLKKWMQPMQRQGNPIMMGSSKAYVKYQPKGVIGNIVSWNFPFDVSMGPTLDALAAGNRVIIKPSDLTPACGELLHEMISQTFDQDQVAVVNGGLQLAQHFSTLKWDHLLYTGSTEIGKQIMKNAAVNLVPVTLELGGKCPVIVSDDQVNQQTAKVIVGVKMIKRGQLCVTADYCLVSESKLNEFVNLLKTELEKIFSNENGKRDGCSIINTKNVQRIYAMVNEARLENAQIIQIGADVPNENRNLPFYIIINPARHLQVAKQEAFGPVLAVYTYKQIDDAIAFVNEGEKPLGIYIFSKDKEMIDSICTYTTSGGVAINTVGMQASLPSLTFGGAGSSGMGRHHGEEGFREFSIPRGYFELGKGGNFSEMMPPYSDGTNKIINIAYADVGTQVKFALKAIVQNLKAYLS
ncbi:MAG: aldehyde dehydrogenase family protein [Pseudobdellovibrio sp.]